MGELVTRVHSLIRRTAGHASPVLAVGRPTLDTGRMTVLVDGNGVWLSPLEYRFLSLLAHNPGKFLSATEIGEHLHGTSDASDANAIEALVLRLRRKLGAEVIESRRGFGYMISGS